MPDSATSVYVDDLYETGETNVVICGNKMQIYTAFGKLLWEIDYPCGRLTCGNFRSGAREKDLLILDDLSLFNLKGEFQFKKNETIYLPTLVHNFDGSGKMLIAGHKKEDVCTSVYDGDMRCVYSLPTFGNIAAADILGDGISQIIIYNDENIDIYSAKETDFTESLRGFSRPQPKNLYNVSCNNALSANAYSNISSSDESNTQGTLNWIDTYVALNQYNSFSKVSRGEFVQIMATLLNLNEDFSDNFADVPKDNTYYNSIGIFRKLEIITSEDNMFAPDVPITVLFANEILDKLSAPLRFKFDDKYQLSKQDAAKLILSLKDPG